MTDRMRTHFYIILFIAVFLMSGMGCLKSEAKSTAGEKKVLRVGYPIQRGITEKDEYGNYSGYTYEYLQEIAQYTGWEYEFVEVPGDINESLTTMLEMLETGDLDIMGCMAMNESTVELFDFPEYGYGYRYYTLNVPDENTLINEANYQTLKKIRIAVYEKAVNSNENLRAFCEVNNLNYEFIYGNSRDELIQAIEEGRADVLVGNDLNPIPGYRTIAQYDGATLYFAVPKGQSQTVNELNRTIRTIHQIKPYFESSLYDKYFSIPSLQIYLTNEEEEYVEKSGTLRVAVVDSLPPIQYTDGSGEIRGVVNDILLRTEEQTGLKFEYLKVSDYEEGFDLIKSGKADMIAGIPYDYKLAQDHGLIMSSSFLSAQMVLMVNGDQSEDLSGNQVGMIEGMQELGKSDFLYVTSYPSVSACMDAFSKGEIDSVYMNLYMAENLLHNANYTNMRLIPQYGKDTAYCIGINKSNDILLVSILNKVFSKLTASELEAIVYQNTTNSMERATFKTVILQNPILCIGILSSFFLFLVIVGIFVLRMQQRNNKQMAVQNLRYLKLSELANEYIYEYDCKKDVLTFSDEFCGLFQLPKEIPEFSIIDEKVRKNKLHPDLTKIFCNIYEINQETEYLCTLPGGGQRWFRDTRAVIQRENSQVIYIIGKLTDVQSEREKRERLEHSVQTDGLTGIYNSSTSKSIIQERLSEITGQSAVLIIDIDNFKEVNDRLGHYLGDIVLKDFAAMLTDTVGKWDVVGRLGGDEFIVYISAAENYDKISALCRALCEKARKEYTNKEGASKMVTISIGAALIREKCKFIELYQAVDKELYRSKKKGRDCYTLIEYQEPVQLS